MVNAAQLECSAGLIADAGGLRGEAYQDRADGSRRRPARLRASSGSSPVSDPASGGWQRHGQTASRQEFHAHSVARKLAAAEGVPALFCFNPNSEMETMIGAQAWEQCPDNGGRMRILAAPASAVEKRGVQDFLVASSATFLSHWGRLIRGVTG